MMTTKRIGDTLGCLLLAVGSIAATAPGPGFRLADFEKGDLTNGTGLLFMVIADDELGGQTQARVESIHPGASGSSAALRLTTSIRPGFTSPFGGVWTPLDREGKLVDLTAYRTLRFQARGSGVPFLAGFRRGGPTDSANFLKAFTPTETWSSFDIDLADLTAAPPAAPSLAWSPHEVSWMGFTSKAGSIGDLWLEIDDVELVGSSGAPPREATAIGSTSSASSKVVRTRVIEAPDEARLEWKRLAEEKVRDGRYPSLPDASALSYATKDGRLWFRIDLLDDPPSDWLGVNVAIDGDGDSQNGVAWWGFNKEFHFDRLLSAYLTRSGSEYQGVVGVTDSEGTKTFDFTRLGSDNVSVAVDRASNALILSVALPDVDDDGSFHVIATVGSPFIPNDDIPDRGFAAIEPEK
jgi:hypothetical protein